MATTADGKTISPKGTRVLFVNDAGDMHPFPVAEVTYDDQYLYIPNPPDDFWPDQVSLFNVYASAHECRNACLRDRRWQLANARALVRQYESLIAELEAERELRMSGLGNIDLGNVPF